MVEIHIPYGAYWSTPFCRWQGSLAGENALELAAKTASAFFSRRGLPPAALDGIVLGHTIPQPHSFYGAPWVAGMIGAPTITGPTVAQACATSVRAILTAAAEVASGHSCVLAVTCDRTSNGPHILYPNPRGIGGAGNAENPVWDNFRLDPHARCSMIETAENVAKKTGITRVEQDHVALMRYEQYQASLADDRAFQRRFLQPALLRAGKGNATIVIDADEGIHDTTAQGLARLQPVAKDGTVTYGTQTHPADGNAGMLVCTPARAKELGTDPAVVIRVLAFGEARVQRGAMPMAPVPAARQALARAGMDAAACRAIKTHNPFALSDIYLGRELGVEISAINRFGCSLVYGHPQGPTGMRAIIELIEELVAAGGGRGLFAGCAAGDTAMAAVIEVA
jgi:acetyl-CoA acetyltransferase family protein